MIKFEFRHPWLIALIFLLTPLAMASISPFIAYVSETSMAFGDSITLTLELIGTSNDQPELGELRQSFDILSESMSTESAFNGGKQFAKTKWIYEIAPKNHETQILIPSIKLGSYFSNPLKIKILANQTKSSNEEGIWFTANIDTNNPYVKEQVILTIELKTNLSLQNGSIEKPEVKNAIIEPLGEDDNREVFENGIRYIVFTRKYALFFSEVGLQFISPIKFEGSIPMKSSGRSWPGFFGAGKRIRNQTNNIKINVKSMPESFPKSQTFLPVKNFTIIESFDQANQTFAVSKAVSRHFELKAIGTLPSFLPIINPPSLSNSQVYAEPGEKNQEASELGIVAVNNFSHVYIPLTAGKLDVPEQTFYWWDTTHDELKTTNIRALQVEVIQTGVLMPEAPMPEKISEKIITPKNSSINLWLIIAIIFILLWLFTLFYFLHIKKLKIKTSQQKFTQTKINSNDLLKNLIQACDNGEAKKVLNYLQAMKIDETNQTLWQKIKLLESTLYGANPAALDKTVLQDIKNKLTISDSKKISADIKPLYPL